MTRTPVTIVIPAWNAVQMTRNCLAALAVTLGPHDQVVVVDNGSQDDTPALLAAQDWIDVVTHEENVGFAAGCNAGAREARNPVIVFLNNDTLPTSGWIEGLVAPFVGEDVGATGPMSNQVSGPQLLTDESYRPQEMADIARYADALRRRASGHECETDRLVGFCLAVRASVFAEIGGFDESFGMGGCEDDDLCTRLRFAGWRLVIVEDTFVHHVGHQTFDVNNVDWFELQQQNATKLELKWATVKPVSFVVLCGSETLPLIASLMGIQQIMGAVPFEVVLLVPDREPLAEALEGIGGATLVDVAGMSEDRAWQLGRHRATGVRRAMLRAGEAVDLSALQQLVDTEPRVARPTHVGTVMGRNESNVPQSDDAREGSSSDRDVPQRNGAQSTSEPDNRELYLNLMQKCLLNTIYEDPSQDPWSDKRFDAAKRAGGLDWPSLAHTMIGERRMASLRVLVEAVLSDQVPGDLIETGVWRGGACIYMRAILKAYGATDRRVFAADSFEGLPPPDPANYPADAGDLHHTFEPLAVSLEEVESNFKRYDLLDDQVVFLKGWFKDSLGAAPIEQLSILRLDGDMYESTMDALVALYHKVSPGGYVIVDDFVLAGCNKAVHEFRAQHGIEEPIVAIDSMSAYWRVSKTPVRPTSVAVSDRYRSEEIASAGASR